MKLKGVNFDDLIEQWGLDYGTAADFFGVHERTTRRWKRRNDFPESVVMLIQLMVDKSVSPAGACVLASRRVKGVTHEIAK